MTHAERAELAEIRKAMSNYDTDYVDAHWDRYLELSELEAEEYRAEQQEEFDAFYKEHIQGKRWEDIDPENWQFYSDWHKDMYGFRPRMI